MKTKHLFLAFVVISLNPAAYAASYRFDWKWDNQTVTGFFDGTGNGNRIENVGLTTLKLNGTQVDPAGGTWFSSSYNPSTLSFTTDNGWLSIDGADNNIVFGDADFPLSSNVDYFFYSITSDQIAPYKSYGYRATILSSLSESYDYIEIYDITEPNHIVDWSVSQLSSVPEPATLALMGLGIVVASQVRRRKVQV